MVKKSSSRKTKTMSKNTQKDSRKGVSKVIAKIKAFTLVELLSVVVVNGLIALFAVPGVARYISDSRLNKYVATSKSILSEARGILDKGILDATDVDATYYLPFEMINTEDSLASPFGSFKEGYVVFTYNGSGYDYYWTCVDTSNKGIQLTKADDLSKHSIISDIEDINTDIGVCGKNIIIVYDEDGHVVERKKTRNCFDAETGMLDNYKLIKMVDQQVKGKISTGDEIIIGGKEAFNVVSTNDDTTVLLAKYNLLVGYEVKHIDNYGYKLIRELSPNITGYGYQNENTINEGYGVVPFSGKRYWQDAGNSSIYNKSLSTVRPNVSDYTNQFNYRETAVEESDYTISYYVEPYINRIEEMGVKVIDGGLLSSEQANTLGCNSSCSYYDNTWLRNTSFWVASGATEDVTSQKGIKTISESGFYGFADYNSVTSFGVRPTITIRTSDIAY